MTDARDGIGAPTLVCGFPKSGTTLVAALLDGHPDLLCFPEETWALKVASRFPHADWLDHILASEGVRRLGQGVADGPDGPRDFTGFDFARFESEAARRWAASDGSPRSLMESVVGAFGCALGRGGVVRWVEKSPEHELQLARHAADWPDLRVVHVVRDPRAVLCSFRRKRARHEQRIYVDGLAARWRAGIAAVVAHEERNPGAVTIVRYEDVVREHRATLTRILDALGCAWDAAVETPTLLGRPWRGNSMYAAQIEGISAASVERWQGEIDADERAVIEACLHDELAALGYCDDDGGPRRGARSSAVRVVLRHRAGPGARLRSLLRLRGLRRAKPAPVASEAFRRASSSVAQHPLMR